MVVRHLHLKEIMNNEGFNAFLKAFDWSASLTSAGPD